MDVNIIVYKTADSVNQLTTVHLEQSDDPRTVRELVRGA